MNCFEGIVDDLNTRDFDFIGKNYAKLEDLKQSAKQYFERVNSIISKYQETGIVPDLSSVQNWQSAEPINTADVRRSLKENVEPAVPLDLPPRTCRTRRDALKESTQNEQIPLRSTRSRRVKNEVQTIQMKTEKLSISSAEAEVRDVTDSAGIPVTSVIIKTEMPAPSKPAPKRKPKKESKVQVKQEKLEENKNRDSDVIIEDKTITMINLSSSDEDEKVVVKKEADKEKKRKSRTYSSDQELEKPKEKKSKSNDKEQSPQFEDALSTCNATFVTEPTKPADATMVVENPKLVKNLVPPTVADLMTDDESDEEVRPKKKSPPKYLGAIPKLKKPVLSPFTQSPVKQKVQAFEKLQEEANALPPRITRTKTRALAKELGDEPTEEPKSVVKEKAKMFTPASSKFIPKAQSTMAKPSRPTPSSSNENLLSIVKSASALKASQAEYREREKKRREREQEALQKRDALIQAQTEEKKRKREEKQLKAQQQREQLEREKIKALEQQKLKDERHRRLVEEQEGKKQKHKEEMEKKRLLAKMRALEEKQKEEQRRQEEMAKQRAVKAVPVYMKSRAPRLPTEDCYDSDEEGYTSNRHCVLPDWARESHLKFTQKCTFMAGEAVKNTFFSIQAQTADLQEIFEVIEPQKLKRTSSAVWRNPPRFTMVPGLEAHDETAECDDEDFE